MVFAKDEAAFNSAYLKVKCALGGQVSLLEYLEGIRNRNIPNTVPKVTRVTGFWLAQALLNKIIHLH